MDDIVAAKPVYEYLDGWSEDISEAGSFEELPATCQAYVRRLEELSAAGSPASASARAASRSSCCTI
jgi:adenylosuccinate synthase